MKGIITMYKAVADGNFSCLIKANIELFNYDINCICMS